MMKLSIFLIALAYIAVASANSRVKRQLGNTCTDPEAKCEYTCPDGYVEDAVKSCGILTVQKCCVIAPSTKPPGPTIIPPVDSCGLNKYESESTKLASSYIVGGEDTLPNEVPWQVSLQKSSHTCGGSIINKRWIVSAAHCFSVTSVSSWRVIAGKHSLRKTDASERTYKVEKIYKHPQYTSSKSNKNDIALMKVTEDIEFNQYVQPVCVAPADYGALDGDWVEATGWGATKEGGSLATYLQKVSVPVITNAECSKAYPRETVYDSSICAGKLDTGGIDSCQGDSGGPLVHRNVNGSDVLVGITSWGYGCAQKGYPGVYTRVSEFWDWIWDNAQ